MQPPESRLADLIEVLHDAQCIRFAYLRLHNFGDYAAQFCLFLFSCLTVACLFCKAKVLEEMVFISLIPGIMCQKAPLFEHCSRLVQEALVKFTGRIAFFYLSQELFTLQITHQSSLFSLIGFSYFQPHKLFLSHCNHSIIPAESLARRVRSDGWCYRYRRELLFHRAKHSEFRIFALFPAQYYTSPGRT